MSHRISVESLGVHLVVVVLRGQVEEDAEGEVQVVRVGEAGLLAEPKGERIWVI